MRPRLRVIESIVVPDERFGRALLLRDSHGVSAQAAVIPAPLIPIVARFTGQLTLEEIAQDVSREMGTKVPLELVKGLAESLDRALLLDSPAYRAERGRAEEEFAGAEVREAVHAGGAYHGEVDALRAYIDGDCLGRAMAEGKETYKRETPLRGLVAPHIDPWRGALGYGSAYGALKANLPDEADTFVLLGTSHAPMKEPFSLCRKAFATPFGALSPDLEMIDAIAARSPFDPYADIFNHKREHSLEFQAVFLRHLIGDREARIIPVLCGLGESQRTGTSPEDDANSEGFIAALRDVTRVQGERVVFIAGADLAHVGPRFGDPAPYDRDARRWLERADLSSLELAVRGEAEGFFSHVQEDLERRRICGLGPIYTLLRALPEGVRGDVLHYEQTVDAREGSIVSHAAVGFYD